MSARNLTCDWDGQPIQHASELAEKTLPASEELFRDLRSSVPYKVWSAFSEIASDKHKLTVLVSCAQNAVIAGNRFTLLELLGIAQTILEDATRLKTVGDFLGFDTELHYPSGGDTAKR